MAKKVGGLDEGEVKKIRAESIGLLNDLDSIGKNINENLAKVSELTGESTSAFKESFNAAKSLGDAISKIDAKTLASKKAQANFNDKVRKAQEEATKLEAKASRLRQESVNFTKAQAQQAFRVARAYEDGAEKLREQAKSAEKLTDEFTELNKQTKVFDDLAEFFDEIPGVSKVFGEFQRASDAAREAASEGSNAFAAGAKQLTGALTKGLAAFGIAKFVEALNVADERTTSLGRNLNKSAEESDILLEKFNAVGRSIDGLTGGDLQKAAEGFAKSMGSTAIASNDVSEELATQVKYMGQSEESANKFAKYSLATGQNAKKLGNQIRGQVLVSNALNKTAIRYQDILEEVSNASAAVKLSTKGIGGNLGNAAIAAKKLGLDLAGVDKVADSLLNFEESISSEMEAELLTGQELNLEEARRLALGNDLEGVAREIAKQGITSEKFGKMNRLQQEATAKALGMSRDEMAEMFQEQKALSALGAKDKTELNSKVKLRLQEIDKIKDLSKREEARAKLMEEVGNEELVRQQENQSLAERQAEASEKMVEAMSGIKVLIEPIAKVFKFLAEHAEMAAKALGLLVGASMIGKIGKMIKMIRGAGTGLKGLMGAIGGGGGGASAGGAAATAGAAGGAAASAAGDVAEGAAGAAGKAAAKGGGGFFGKVGSFFGDIGKKLNPLNFVKGKLGKIVGKILKFPIISTLLESVFAGADITNMIAEGGKQSDIYKKIGVRGGEAIGSIGGSAIGGILGSALGPLGTAAGGLLGDSAGRWLGGKLTELLGPEKFGKTIANTFGYDKDIEEGIKNKTIEAKDYVIKTLPEDTVVGAGGTKLGRTDEMVTLLERLVATVEKGGNVYIDGTKAGTSFGMSSWKLQ